jgi:hypothetical protein
MHASLGVLGGVMVESSVRPNFDAVAVQIHYRSYLGRVGGVHAEGIPRGESFSFSLWRSR